MRKVTCGLTISLDGVVESPASWGGFRFLDQQMTEIIGTGIAQADTILLGRRTYQQFAEMWPQQGSDVPMADFLNNTPKYVVSSTFDDLEWGPATLLRGDVVDAVTDLKGQPGKNIQVPGSPTLVKPLLLHGLLDELGLMVCPVVAGSGMRLFDGLGDQMEFTLVGATPLSTGGLAVTYQPANRTMEDASFPEAAGG